MENVLKILSEFSTKGKRESPYLKDIKLEEEIKNEIKMFLENDPDFMKISNELFPNGIPNNEKFIRIINELEPLLGFNYDVYVLKGLIIVYYFKIMSAENVHQILTGLLVDNNRDFWGVLRCLPTILEHYELSPMFAANWFVDLHEKVKLDFAGGDAYMAISNYSYKFPNSGMQILDIYLKAGLEGSKLNIASMILGDIRSVSKNDKKLNANFQIYEKNMHLSKNIINRICYFASWGTTFKRLGIDKSKLIELLKEMIIGDEKEIEQAYLSLYACLMIDISNEDFNIFTIDWIKEQIPTRLSSQNKHIVAEMLRWISHDLIKNPKNINIKDLRTIFEFTLPVQFENKGTWSTIQDFLINLIDLNFDEFMKNLILLNQKNNSEIIKIFQEGSFDFLKHTIDEKLSLVTLFEKLIISKEEPNRVLGFTLFNVINIKNKGIVNLNINVEDQLLNIILLEFQLKGYLGEHISLFLSLVDPLFAHVNEDLKKEFTFELTYQAINYPGYCYERWKEKINPSDLMKTSIKNAESYFDKFKRTEKLTGNNIDLDVFERASKTYLREISKKISEVTDEKSTFLKFVRKTNILYGTVWSTSYEGKISSPSNFGQFSHSMEFPRLDTIDPEGAWLKRMEAKLKLKKLLKDVH